MQKETFCPDVIDTDKNIIPTDMNEKKESTENDAVLNSAGKQQGNWIAKLKGFKENQKLNKDIETVTKPKLFHIWRYFFSELRTKKEKY